MQNPFASSEPANHYRYIYINQLPEGNRQSMGHGLGSAPQRFFNGSIDDVRIYNRALTPPEIQALYNEYQ